MIGKLVYNFGREVETALQLDGFSCKTDKNWGSHFSNESVENLMELVSLGLMC